MCYKNKLYVIIYLCIFILLIIDRVLSTFSHKKICPRISRDLYRPFLWILIAGYIAAILISLYEFIFFIKIVSFVAIIYGAIFLSIGIYLRRKAIDALGEEWNISIKIFPKQKLITSGIYKKLKHPYHYAVLFELYGFSLLSNSFWSFLFIIFFQTPLLFVRIWLEERILSRKFGKIYTEYTKATLI